MATATVGSLNVVMGMDAGDFNKGVRQIESQTDKLSRRLNVLMDHAKTAGAALVAAIPVAAFGMAIKNAIDVADALDETAQKVGLTVEQLSRLKYAAELNGVPLEKLQVGLGKLSQSMMDIASGNNTGAAARSFAALGISATDVNGKLRDTEQVILDLAEKFAGFEDDAGKTALAMNIFGKSGADLIPFLNKGRDGIAQLNAEADRFGITLSSKTAAAAAELNEALDKLTAISGGKFNRFLEKILPELLTLTKYLEDTKGGYGLLDIALDAVNISLKLFQTILIDLDNRLQNTIIRLQGYAEALQAVASMDFTAASEAWGRMTTSLIVQSQAAEAAIRQMWGAAITSPAQGAAGASGLQGFIPSAEEVTKQFAPIIQSTKDLTEATRLSNEQETIRQQLMAQGTEIMKQVASPLQLMALEIDKVDQLYRKSAISAEVAGRAMQMAAFGAANAYGQAASKIMGNLQSVFAESKGFAIAQALVNTYEAVTAALKGPPGPPWSYAIAASALAAGMAQVSSIRSTNKGGGGGGGSASSVSSSGASAGAAAAAPGASAGQTMFVRGFSQSEMWSGDMVRGVVERLIDFQRDGGSIVLER